MSSLRMLIAVFGFAGAAFFGTAFVISYASPGFVERIAKGIIQSEVEKRVHDKLAALDGGRLAGIAERVSKRNAEEVAKLRRQLSEGLPGKIAQVVGEMRHLDCECRKQVEKSVSGDFEWRIAVLSQANERLAALIRTKYMEVSEKLTKEFRVFTGANALVLLFLGLTVGVRKQARLHLLPPAAVLVCAAGAVAYFYVFQQDWFHTILFSDYVGFGYFAYVGVAFLFLSDVVFNRARITSKLLNAAFHVVGSAATVVPC